MPWKDYPVDVRQFKGLIEAAAHERFGSAGAVELVSKAAAAAGVKLGFASYSGIAKMYGELVGVREAGNALRSAADVAARTGIDQGVTAQMISRPPWAPDVASTTLNPFVLVKGRYSMPSPEGTITSYFTHRYLISEIHTLGQVKADMQAQMEQNVGGTNLDGATLDEVVGIEWSTA